MTIKNRVYLYKIIFTSTSVSDIMNGSVYLVRLTMAKAKIEGEDKKHSSHELYLKNKFCGIRIFYEIHR